MIREGLLDGSCSATTTLGEDDSEKQTSLTDPEGNTTSWVYDTLNHVTLDTNELNDSRSFAYDSNGNLTTRTDRIGRVIQYACDHLNPMNEESWYVGGVLQETRDFRFDAMGNLTSVNSDEAVYAFAADHTSQADESYAFDDNRNRTGRGTSTDDDNRLLSDGTYDYLYDAEGNRVQKTNIATGANHMDFDSFGNRISETNAAIESLFGDTGREWGDDIDLQYNRARSLTAE